MGTRGRLGIRNGWPDTGPQNPRLIAMAFSHLGQPECMMRAMPATSLRSPLFDMGLE